MNPRHFKNLGRITTPFGGQTRGERSHMGVDVANVSGTPIPALADGQITAVGPTGNGLGNVVTLKDTGGNTHQYGHLQGSLVKPGMRVKRGQPIAKMGRTGNVYSPSGGDPSHVDVRIADAYKRYKDPTKFL